jgi:hypothetical protein
MMKRFYRFLWIGFVLLLAQLACGVSVESAPEPPASEPLAPEAVPTPAALVPTQAAILPQPAVTEARMLTLEFPPRIRAGDADVVRLTLEVDTHGNLTATAETAGNVTRGEVIEIPNIYATHYVSAEARLDLAGVQVSPPGAVSESLRPGQKLTFLWSVRAEDVGIYRGTLWFYLIFTPRDGGPEERQALSAQKIEIEAVDFLGLKAQPARLVGVVGAAASAVLGMPFLEEVLKWFWRRFRKA